ncbi:MAG: hypothetical protein V4722_16365 [Bacteroidota bacterium]
MQLVREKETLYFIAKSEAEAAKAEAILKPLLKKLLPDEAELEKRTADLERFDELTKDFQGASNAEIETLAIEVNEAMWQDYKAKRNL